MARNIKLTIILVLACDLLLSGCHKESDNSSATSQESPAKMPAAFKLDPDLAPPPDVPTDILVEELPNGSYRYTICGVYSQYMREEDKRYLDRFEIKAAKHEATFVWPEKIESLEEWCDHQASGMGLIPYWAELKTRDLKSSRYNERLYRLAANCHGMGGCQQLWEIQRKSPDKVVVQVVTSWHMVAKDFVKLPGLSEITVSRDKGKYSISVKDPRRFTLDEFLNYRENRKEVEECPVQLGNGRSGAARINRTTAYCMGENRQALRVFNSSGRYLWEDTTTLEGHCFVAAFDFDNDGKDEILVLASGHQGGTFLYVPQ